MYLTIDPSRSLPIFAQIMEGIRLAIATGRLKSGDRIPSVRDMAVETRVNPNTVARAYMDLERAGVIETKRGLGYFVTSCLNGELAGRERRVLLDRRVEELLTAALELGFNPEDVKDAIDRNVEKLHKHDES
jgi:GntR family transcriptional regulator